MKFPPVQGGAGGSYDTNVLKGVTKKKTDAYANVQKVRLRAKNHRLPRGQGINAQFVNKDRK